MTDNQHDGILAASVIGLALGIAGALWKWKQIESLWILLLNRWDGVR